MVDHSSMKGKRLAEMIVKVYKLSEDFDSDSDSDADEEQEQFTSRTKVLKSLKKASSIAFSEKVCSIA